MSSWVRYSVAVYAGLLFAGSMLIPKPEASALTEWVPFAVKKQERANLPRWPDVHSPRGVAASSVTQGQAKRPGEHAGEHDLSKPLEQHEPGEPVELESAKRGAAAAGDDAPHCER